MESFEKTPRFSRWKKRLAQIGGAIVVLYVSHLSFFFWVMHQPPEIFSKFIDKTPMPLLMTIPFPPMWNIARGGDLEPGDLVPDFELSRESGDGAVRLSTFRDQKPVVLIFGSYT